ncbi:hypothetical protein HC931_08790 [Candidatus Gracilibacteria bacterium]|jgi:hypothetical protein|nr:hypothetical protein [Candidatus Gracilibacteria bacterium]NJM89577.1 hypothetical protein [Hydrococcus sp. RU_2_2]NJP21620.1 hypothetical protein [Hydrococcus sp. CRU_1_1]
MNIRLIIFSGIVTATLGTVLGTAAKEICKDHTYHARYESQFYQNLYDKYSIFGAGLGFAIGCTQQCIRELKTKREKN